MIKTIVIDDEAYQEYVQAMKVKIGEEDRERLSQVRIFEKNRTMLMEERDNYVRKSM
jgi:hypothetical protein